MVFFDFFIVCWLVLLSVWSNFYSTCTNYFNILNFWKKALNLNVEFLSIKWNCQKLVKNCITLRRRYCDFVSFLLSQNHVIYFQKTYVFSSSTCNKDIAKKHSQLLKFSLRSTKYLWLTTCNLTLAVTLLFTI